MTHSRSELGDQARIFVLGQLKDGLRISRHLLSRPIKAGSVMACIRDDADMEKIQRLSSNEFHYGGITSLGDSLACISDFLMHFLEASPNRLCVFEDYCGSPSDPWISQDKLPIFRYEDHIYRPVPSGSSREQIVSTISEADSTWILVGIATSVPDISEWSTKAELTDEEIALLAKRTEYIIIGAFDGEGFLICTEPDSRGI